MPQLVLFRLQFLRLVEGGLDVDGTGRQDRNKSNNNESAADPRHAAEEVGPGQANRHGNRAQPEGRIQRTAYLETLDASL